MSGGVCVTDDVILGTFVFNTVDAYGVTWIIEDIDGWWYLPDVSLPDIVRTDALDGSYSVDGSYNARLFTIKGHYFAPTAIDIELARGRLLAAMDAVRREVTLQVNENVPKRAQVRLASRPRVATVQQNGRTEFEIPLKAADPRKYDVSETTATTRLPVPSGGRTYNRTYPLTYGASGLSGIITAFNNGTYSSPGMIIFNGPVDNPSVESLTTGNKLAFTISLGIGDTLTVDLQNHAVVLNGAASRRYTLTYDSTWFSIEPGENDLRYGGVQSIPASPPTVPFTTMEVVFRSAWMG